MDRRSIPMRALKFIIKPVLSAAVLLAVLLLLWWVRISAQIAHVTFSNDRYCKLEFHQWFSGRSILSYYENGACIGIVKLNNDLFNDPIALFPGPDAKSVVCLSWPDTFEAAFTVDFSKRNDGGVVIPDRLRLDGQEAVDFSNFEVRACTQKEVDFVRHFIESADPKTLSSCTRYGPSEHKEEIRANLIHFLALATSPRDWNDPNLKDASPLILPENP